MEKLTKEQIENLPEWLPIEGFPNYEVNCREGIIRNIRVLKVLKTSLSDGYPRVGMWKDGKVHTKTVHRTVANAAFSFYNISTDGLLVMHLDEERHNPRIDNLALGSYQENMSFEKAKQRRSEAQKGKHLSEAHRKKLSEAKKGEKNPNFGTHRSAEFKKKVSKRVGAYKDGKLTLIFSSVRLTKVYGYDVSAVCNCCKGRQRAHRGYFWKYL